MENLDFLKQKYNLHNSEEVASAAKRTKIRTKEKISQKPLDQIENYLDRFKEIIERKDKHERERGLMALKQVLHEKFVIKPEEVPEAAFLLEQRIARDLGHGNIEIDDRFRKRKTEQIINDQKKSLDKWIDYLSSADAMYPDWAKYWAFRSMLEMGRLQKEEDKEGKEIASFQKRTKDTVAPFPQLNPRALAMTISSMQSRLEEKNKPKDQRNKTENKSVKISQEEFEKLISTENFSKIYTQFLIEMPEYSKEGLKETRGRWVKYERGQDGTKLAESLEGYPLEWCTANPDTARSQLHGGDFYVYYSIDQENNPKIPRVAIRMQGDSIAEVRGIAAGQNMDPYIGDVVEEKMSEFGAEGEQYKKKAADMKLLTSIETKLENEEDLTKEELRFLHEIDAPIKGFGNDRDPRIDDLLSKRDFKEDIEYIFNITSPEEIAYSREEINEKTKVILGRLELSNTYEIPQSVEYVQYLQFQMGLNQQVLERLIKLKKIDLIANINYDEGDEGVKLRCFQDLDRNMAEYLISKGYGKGVAMAIKSFNNADHSEIIKTLVSHGYAEEVANRFFDFNNIDHFSLAKQLVENGCESSYGINFSEFEGFTVNTAKKLISWRGDVFTNNISKFHGLNQEVALLLIDEGKSHVIDDNLERFEGLNYPELVKCMIMFDPKSNIHRISECSDAGRDLADFLERQGYRISKYVLAFNEETQLAIIKSILGNMYADHYDYDPILENFSKLKCLNRDFAEFLIKSRPTYTHLVVKNIALFHGLDNSIARLLIEGDNIYRSDEQDGTEIVTRSPDLFGGLDRETIKLLIYRGNISMENLELYRSQGLSDLEIIEIALSKDEKNIKLEHNQHYIVRHLSEFTGLSEEFKESLKKK